VFIRTLLTVNWQIIENTYYSDNNYIDDIKKWENAIKKINTKTQLKIKDFKNTPQTKLSLQLFPNLQYVAFVSLLWPEYNYYNRKMSILANLNSLHNY